MTTAKFLQVPISLQLLLTNRFQEEWKKPVPVAPKYRLLDFTALGSGLATPPFAPGDPLPKGAHLHFILPDGLTHGIEGTEGFRYPVIPDRWLVTRRQLTDGKILHRSWLVEGNYIGTDNRESVVIPTLEDPARLYRYLGRSFEWGSAPKKPGTYQKGLTVFGAGDASFSAYYPSCKSVLGFHDPLEDVAAATLCYTVVGWHSQEEDDPLYGLAGEERAQKLAELGWGLPQGKSFETGRCLYHGAVYGARWEGDEYDYPSGKPLGAVDIAAGNTSAEALSALLAQKLQPGEPGRERMLTALQYDLLELFQEVDGVQKVEDGIYRRSFSTLRAGTRWVLRGDQKQKDFPPEARALLDKLNEEQRGLDRHTHNLEELCQELFAVWHLYLAKYETAPREDKPPFRDEIHARFLEVHGRCGAEKKELEACKDAVEAAKSRLEAFLKEQKLGGEFLDNPDENFYRPADPVLLFSGDGVDRSYLFGEDGRYTENGLLLCRPSGCGVDRLEVEAGGRKVSLIAADLWEKSGEWASPGALPGDFRALFCESVLLDPGAAPFLAAAVYEKLGASPGPGELERLAKVIREGGKAFPGVRPSPLALRAFAPPWATLFLEWEVRYHPTRGAAGPDDSMEGWDWNGIDFDYGREFPGGAAPAVLRGRTVVTPHSQKILSRSLLRYLENRPGFGEGFVGAAKKAGELRVVSQSLGGLADLLLGREWGLQMPVCITSEELEEDPKAQEMTEKLATVLEGRECWSPVGDGRFLPIRAGFLKLSRVNLINTFGQRQVLASGLDRLLISENVRCPQDPGALCLSPKLAGPARLLFDWSPLAQGEGSPVCGYLVPNRLNRGLMVYNPDGTLLGALRLAWRKGKKSFALWVPMPEPGEDGTAGETPWANRHLRELVDTLREDREREIFRELLLSLDCWQEGIVTGDSYGEDLSVLCGRPAALLRAGAGLDPMGPLPHSQNTGDFGREERHDLEKIPFPLWVGDANRACDGVLGFFPDGPRMYRHMRPAAGCQPPPGVVPAYVDYQAKTSLSLGDGEPLGMTLLVEVMGNITLRTGVLPPETRPFPGTLCRAALERMRLAFELNPVLTSPKEAAIPVAEDGGGTWSWLVKTGETTCAEYPDVASPPAGFTGEPPELMDGYLVRRKGK